MFEIKIQNIIKLRAIQEMTKQTKSTTVTITTISITKHVTMAT